MIILNNELYMTQVSDGEDFELYRNCTRVLKTTVSEPSEESNYKIEYKLTSGVYQLVRASGNEAIFHYEDKCNLLCKFDQKLYYYYIALSLAPQCPGKYAKLCSIYNEFEHHLNKQCYECM